MDISFRIFKKYPNKLYTTPHAKAFHKASPVARLKPKNLIYMEVIYPTYFFFKNMERTPLNMAIFVWAIFGRFALTLISKNRKSVLFLIRAYIHLFRNFTDIKRGKIK